MSDADGQWLEDLWSKHGGQVYAYAARRIGRELAEDVVGDVFLVAWRRRRERPRRELPWLYGVARRVLADRYRADSRRARLIERAGREPHDTPLLEDEVVGSMQLTIALAGLNDVDREALFLTTWEGLSASEAAAALDMAAPAFRMRLTRARRRLKTGLAEAVPEVVADAIEEEGKRGK